MASKSRHELNATTETSSNSHSEKIVDGYTWGHELFGDMHSCVMSSSVSNVHRDSLIQRDRNSIWPCWSVRDASTMTDDLVSVSPTKVGAIVDSNGDTAPMYLMGYFEGEPVYRTTFSLTNDREGKEPGCYQLRWSPLFPDVLIPECGLMQADITIRKGFEGLIPSSEDNDSSENENVDMSQTSSGDIGIFDNLSDQSDIKEEPMSFEKFDPWPHFSK